MSATGLAKSDNVIQAPVTPMHLIERAAAAGASIEQMQQLFELKLRVEADEARKAFNSGMAQFKAHPPKIQKNVQKKAGLIDLHYASLDNVVDTITPALSAVGIRHRWEVKQDATLISVTCILSHDLGHSESTTLTGPADGSGSKNPIQAIASTVSYLQRYTLLAATGMAAAGMDTDGGDGPKMPDQEVLSCLDNIDNCSNPDELKKVFSAAYSDAKKVGDMKAQKAFIEAKDKKKKEFAA